MLVVGSVLEEGGEVLRSSFVLGWQDKTDIFLPLHFPYRALISVFRPTDGSARIFHPTTLCRDWESNSPQFSCTSSRDLNSGRFTDLSYHGAATRLTYLMYNKHCHCNLTGRLFRLPEPLLSSKLVGPLKALPCTWDSNRGSPVSKATSLPAATQPMVMNLSLLP